MSDLAETRIAGQAREPEYPTSDGKPMAETDKHRNLAMYVIDALQRRYASDPNVYVSGNNFLYYVEGNPRACVSPDTYVVFGVPRHERDCYMAWKEGGKLPSVIFEFTSKKTRREDTHTKRPRYEQELRVPEYFLFDPTGDYLRPRLQGYRLVEGQYVPLELVNGRLHSQVLGLDLVQEGERLRLVEPASGEALPDSFELEARERQARQRAETEAQGVEAEARARREAEAEVERLRAELEALRRQMEKGTGGA